MERVLSNLVYNVPLVDELVNGSELSFAEIVKRFNKHIIHYTEGRRPFSETPNYISFRYNGRLKSIHKVEGVEILDSLSQSSLGLYNNEPYHHYLFHLGPAIIPRKVVRNGNIEPYKTYCCIIDTLLTCSTIEEANNLTKQRLRGEGYGENIYNYIEDL